MRKKQPTKAANGDGSIYKSTEENRLIGQVVISKPGEKRKVKRFRGPVGLFGSAAELVLREEMKPWLTSSAREGGTETLQSYADRWIERADVSGNTHDYYVNSAKRLGDLGAMALLAIKPKDVAQHLDALLAQGVGQRTRRAVYSLIHRVLGVAADLEIIPKNPASPVEAPKMPEPESHPLGLSEVGVLLKGVRGDRFEAFVVLALTTTMGPAELLALKWENVNLADGFVRVAHNLVCNSQSGHKPVIKDVKAKKRRRLLRLCPLAIDALQRRSVLCVAEGSGAFVFTTTDGKLVDPDNLRADWWKPLVKRIAKAADKAAAASGDHAYRFRRDLRLYDLRHTANAIMGYVGVPIEVASRRMGHSSISMTSDVYGGYYEVQADDSMLKLDGFFNRYRGDEGDAGLGGPVALPKPVAPSVAPAALPPPS